MRTPGRAVCNSRLGRSKTGRGLSALLGGARSIRRILPAGPPGGLPGCRFDRLDDAASNLADQARFEDAATVAAHLRYVPRWRRLSAQRRPRQFRRARLSAPWRARSRTGNLDARGNAWARAPYRP